MASSVRLQPYFLSESDFDVPMGWSKAQFTASAVAVPVGKKWENKTVSNSGRVPVIDQSQAGVIGFHSDPPGVVCSIGRPSFTFANHTCAMRWMDSPFSCIQNVFAFRGAKGIDTRFLYYASMGRVVLEEYKGHAPQLRRMWIPIPPEIEQKTIGSFLGDFDARIELCRQTNATLEAIAQALFKSWFVDFDPVRAKAEGREPEGMDATAAALFPSEFEESEFGLIPKGWQVASLKEHIDAERGLSYKGAGLSDHENGVPMHNLNSVLEGGGYKYGGIKFYNGEFKERHIAKSGDLLVANTEQGHHHRLIGFPAIVPHRFKQGLFSHHLYRIRIHEGSPVTKHWINRTLMIPRVRDQIIGCANGSTVNMLKPAGLQIPRFVLPARALLQIFEEIAAALHERIEANVDCADSLATLRDTLLPRLISGKLRFPDSEAGSSSVTPHTADTESHS